MKKSFSIRSYLILSHGLLLIISLGAIGFIWSRNEYQVITRELENLMGERAALLAKVVGHEISEQDDAKVNDGEFPQVHLEEGVLAVYIDDSGSLYNLIPGTLSPKQTDLFLDISSEYQVTEVSYTTLVDTEFDTTNVYASSVVYDEENQRIGVVCLLMPIGHLDSYISRLRWLLLGVILFVVLIGAGVSILLTSYVSSHFSRAQGLAATVADGNYQLRIPEEGPTELRDLSHYLNQMAEKLQGQVNSRRTLLANVAHELARPLAGLQLGIESLRKGAIKDPELADDLLVNMGQTIRHFEGLVDDITLAAHTETKPIELYRTSLAIEPFLQGIATRYWTLAESRGLRLKVQVEANLPPVSADEKRLNQIVGNLVDNAIKFTPRGKTIRLLAKRADKDNIHILVHDGGKGIAPDEVEHLFEPFYQGNVGRYIKQGMGLGLAIAQQLAFAHGGTLVLKNDPEGGALAILTLPLANP